MLLRVVKSFINSGVSMTEDVNSKWSLALFILILYHDRDLVNLYWLDYQDCPIKVLKLAFSCFCSLFNECEVLGASLALNIKIFNIFLTRLAHWIFDACTHRLQVLASSLQELQYWSKLLIEFKLYGCAHLLFELTNYRRLVLQASLFFFKFLQLLDVHFFELLRL